MYHYVSHSIKLRGILQLHIRVVNAYPVCIFMQNTDVGWQAMYDNVTIHNFCSRKLKVVLVAQAVQDTSACYTSYFTNESCQRLSENEGRTV